MAQHSLIEIRDLKKAYTRGRETVEALRGVSLNIAPGEFVSVMGPSGCGKSTLLHVIGGIDRPTGGAVRVNGTDLDAASEDELTRFRRDHVGFVFQFYNLLPTLSALENVELPLVALNYPRLARCKMARAALDLVGLADRASHRPAELSGGQQQRVAIARALVSNPKVILADEPTGDLDSASAQMVVDIIRELNRDLGLTFVVVTHNPEVGAVGTRIIHLRDGQVVGDEAIRTTQYTPRGASGPPA
jgi:putative ABC transport system ATP-binding protein